MGVCIKVSVDLFSNKKLLTQVSVFILNNSYFPNIMLSKTAKDKC